MLILTLMLLGHGKAENIFLARSLAAATLARDVFFLLLTVFLFLGWLNSLTWSALSQIKTFNKKNT